ncbi:magnesium transporter [Chelatococcus asaccharovorans]|uniref:Magnesium transporter MgtE n=1 Tax=Chelatococcus asaccharovorans TaxID=28210 RepID=A0A2V3U685_9HYPH|nr:magnesium transporter [Chelatococcus asaccharovorans]MBS7704022.1 magnesium transporter [Chelatococcus asaccharovorans]PXW58187.1 Mg2+ transporter MgtE [Chelatococcus asaccharovorans]CAH1666841.1 Magnesium transporter MgtE [Chelatococcus asaccharovorans]CAH1681300.1 Magnesium transporter MgtE [Chelatococcus asaccharovorans]
MSDVRETTAEANSFRDTDGEIWPSVVERATRAIQAGDGEDLRDLVADLHEADVGSLLEALQPDDRPRLISLLGKNFDFTALTEVDDTVREEILEELSNDEVAEGVRDLDVDDAVYILEDLDHSDQAEILEKLPALERIALQRGLDYPEDSAGRRMQTDCIAVPPFWSVRQTVDYIRDTPDLPDTFYEVFIVDPAHRLLGAVPLDKLMRARWGDRIDSIATEDHQRVHATDDQENVALLMQRYNLVSVPVVDDSERLVGVMMVDDIVDVLDEEADEDLKALGGVKADEELSDSVWYTVKGRFPWLFANLLTALISASVIDTFEASIQAMVALAVLMPIVASMGGNAGTQTMTVTVRAIATRQLGRANAWRVIRREMTVGLMNGLGFALLLGTMAALWSGVPGLGVIIGLALMIVLTAAAVGGILIPLALHRLKIDPAVSSGPFVTTVTDVIGFFSFLGIATLWLSRS